MFSGKVPLNHLWQAHNIIDALSPLDACDLIPIGLHLYKIGYFDMLFHN